MTIFLTGASGYIGGAVAVRLLRDGHRIRGLVRSPEKAAQLEALGVEPVIGDLSDTALLVREAEAADAVINAASADDRAAVEALIGALAGSGKPFLHTSGTSVVADDARGEWASDRIYDEDTPVEPVPGKAARVAIDRLIVEAAGRGVRSTVLCNSLIYGTGPGLNADSVQIPTLVAEARKSGVVRHVGRGLNIWSNVHVDDMAELYALALARAPPAPSTMSRTARRPSPRPRRRSPAGSASARRSPGRSTMPLPRSASAMPSIRWARTAGCAASGPGRSWAGRRSTPR